MPEKDSDFAPADDPPLTEGASARPLLIAGLFAVIAVALALDVALDLRQGGSPAHVTVEMGSMGLALVGFALLARRLRAARARAQRLSQALGATHRDLERYRAEAADLLRGLGETIERQLERWGLTAAEKEVAVLLLKGLSHKEVAGVRGTSERTARQQARAIYQKAGLEGRAALSAFFLEDLLPPPPPPDPGDDA